eukprot:5229519-Amphidinium_carterae.1
MDVLCWDVISERQIVLLDEELVCLNNTIHSIFCKLVLMVSRSAPEMLFLMVRAQQEDKEAC